MSADAAEGDGDGDGDGAKGDGAPVGDEQWRRRARNAATRAVAGAVLFFFVGFAPFALVNALWAEVPIFVRYTPEKDDIGAYISSTFNAANIFPLVYTPLAQYIPDAPAVGLLCALGVVAALAVGARWDTVVVVHATGVSWVILLSSFASGAVGCTLLVVLFAYTAHFPAYATTAVSAGMAASGVVFAALANFQHAGERPVFSVFVFFIIIAASFVLALGAFAVVHVWLRPRSRAVASALAATSPRSSRAPSLPPPSPPPSALLRPAQDPSLPGIGAPAEPALSSDDDSTRALLLNDTQGRRSVTAGAPSWRLVARIATRAAANNLATSTLVYFMIPGLLPFLTGDYSVLSYMITTAQAASLAGRLLTILPWRVWAVEVLNALQAVTLAGMIIIAVSPMPHVPAWVLIPLVGASSLLNGYTTTIVYLVADRKAAAIGARAHTKHARRCVSLCNQAGSLLGAYTCLLAVALNAFKKKPLPVGGGAGAAAAAAAAAAALW